MAWAWTLLSAEMALGLGAALGPGTGEGGSPGLHGVHSRATVGGSKAAHPHSTGARVPSGWGATDHPFQETQLGLQPAGRLLEWPGIPSSLLRPCLTCPRVTLLPVQ